MSIARGLGRSKGMKEVVIDSEMTDTCPRYHLISAFKLWTGKLDMVEVTMFQG